LRRQFPLLFNTPFGYNNCIVKTLCLLLAGVTILAPGKDDEEVLLQNLASVHRYEKADSLSGYCKLYGTVLRARLTF